MDYELFDKILYQNDRYTILLCKNFNEKQTELKKKIEKAQDMERFKLQIELDNLKANFAREYIIATQDRMDMQINFNLHLRELENVALLGGF